MNKLLAFAVAFLVTLAIVLVPVSMLELKSDAQVTEYEYEVLSGIDHGGMYNLQLTTGWHGDWITGDYGQPSSGIDLIYEQTAGWHATLGADVHAIFRHVGGDRELKARIWRPRRENCKNATVEVFESDSGSTERVAVIAYVHVEKSVFVLKEIAKSPQDRTVWTLNRDQQVTTIDQSLGKIVGATMTDNLGEIPGVEKSRGCSNGPHLHQSGLFNIHLNKSTLGKGLPNTVSDDADARPCISPDEWIVKIVSPGRTPAVTATDAPTTTCPPTNLKLKSGSALTLEFDSPDAVRFEIYKEEADGTFCDADASSCVHDGTAAAGATAGAVTFKKRSESETLSQAMRSQTWPSGKYRARGRGCVGSVCGAWSGWSNTIDHIAPPTDPALVSNPSGTLIMRYRSFGVSGSGKHVFRIQRTGLDRAASFCELRDPETRSCRSAGTKEQDPPRSIPGEDAVHSVFFGARAEGKYRAQAKSCRDADPARDGSVLYDCGAWSDFSPVIYHIHPPESIGLVSAGGALGVSFKSLRAARFQLYKSSGSTCTVGEAGCTLVATITAGASASAALRQATFGQRTGGAYWVRGQSCLTSGARSSGGVGGAADTTGPRVDTGACGAWSALSPEFAHRVPSFGTSSVSDQSWTKGSSVSLTLPAATGGDGTLTYSLSPALPSGVTRTNFAVSGAPSVTKTRTMHTWTATDTHGDKASITFRVTVNAAATVTPAQKYRLTVRANPSSCGSARGTGDYIEGRAVSIRAVPNTNCRFKGWTGSGIANASSSSTTVTMGGADKTVTANFARQCKLTVNSTSGGTATGTGTFDCDTDQPVKARLSDGERFGRWTGDLTSTSSSDTITLDGDKTVQAVFKCKLTVNSTSGGTATGTGTFDCDTDQPVKARLSDGERFGRWTGDLSSTSSSETITLNGNKTVRANFDCRLTVNSGPGGTATGAGIYSCGSTKLVTPAVTTGYRFGRWSGDLTGSANPGRVDLSKNKTVRANFDCRLTVRSSSGGTASGGRTVECSSSTDLRIRATPSVGNYFHRWYGSGIANVWAASTTVDMSRSRTVTPDFEKYRWLNLSASPSSWGAVSGSGRYRDDARVTIRATAKVPASGYGYYFKHWKEGVRIVSTSSTWTFRLDRSRDLIAVFGYICDTEFPCGYAQEEPP